MSGPSGLPFLGSDPWRVAVIAPTGRYARNQVAGMLEAGTPLVAGIALGRGGTTMDGLPLYDRIGDVPQKPNIALIYTPAEGRRYGYYVWPLLLDGHLVGRVDLKSERARDALHVVGAFLEPGRPASKVAEKLAAELRSMASWLGLREVTVGTRGELTRALADALG